MQTGAVCVSVRRVARAVSVAADFDDLGEYGMSESEQASVFERNMLMLMMTSPAAAAKIRAARPAPGLEWVESDENSPGLVFNESAGSVLDPFALDEGAADAPVRVLASRRRPIAEADRLVEATDLLKIGAVCVYGFGAGYHIAGFGEKMEKMGAVVCFEPDLGLLRGVFERIDHTEWMAKTNFVLLTDVDDPSKITAAIGGIEAILALGIRVVEHPASRKRLSGVSARFGETFARSMAAMRTSVMTTLVRAQASLQNVLMNADHYARSDGIGKLTDIAKGRPAIVVSAGPSLDRNLHLLADPCVREKAVIIAAQTMLKPMLRLGIKPHFVCALDYHELSKRFYEGLTATDVEGVVLVVQPKANPAILDAYPGVIRCVQDLLLDSTLGAELSGEKSPMKPGATVAHMCAYMGRHLGCDPLIFIGQDLGFTDGQYYGAGAAIHDVWAGELGPMRSLEAFEWERIVRAKRMLHVAEDVLGRKMYTDEQMVTYLNRFEVDFADDVARGLRVIDATEGGVRKRHAEVMTLAEALGLFAVGESVPASKMAEASSRSDASPAVAARLEEIAKQAMRVDVLSRKAMGVLEKMTRPGASDAKIDRLISDVYKVRDEVQVLEPAYGLVQHMNQTGALRRFRADREIAIEGLDTDELLRRQIERDIENVEWTADAALELADQMRDSAAAIRGETCKATKDPTPREVAEAVQRVKVGAVVLVDPQMNGLGLARDDGSVESAIGCSAIRLTAERLLRCTTLDEIVIASGDPDWLREKLGGVAADPRVRIEAVDTEKLRARTRAVGRGRLMNPDAWRGGLGGLSCYDESLEPGLALEVMERRGLNAGVFVGGDWVLVDPGVVDSIVSRYRERPDAVRLSLTQAAPGLGGILLSRQTVTDIAAGTGHAANFASVGGLLSYLPVSPQADPIAKAFCVSVPHGVRDAGRRLIPDTPEGIALVRGIIDRLGESWLGAGALALVAAVPFESREAAPPRHMELELCTGRLSSGLYGSWLRNGDECERPVLATGDAVRVIEEFARGRPDTVLTLHGVGDPLLHPGVFDVIAAARTAGVGLVHMRTDGLSEAFEPGRLLASGLDVLSVDMLAATRETYRVMAGVDRYEELKERLEAVLGGRGTVAGLPGLWVVPRITRCDEVYDEIEGFYNGWLMACCSASIDPIPAGAVLDESARIRAMPLPALARERAEREMLVVRSDGTALSRSGIVLGNLLGDSVSGVWRAAGRARSRVAA